MTEVKQRLSWVNYWTDDPRLSCIFYSTDRSVMLRSQMEKSAYDQFADLKSARFALHRTMESEQKIPKIKIVSINEVLISRE